jgi:hypothetical protein
MKTRSKANSGAKTDPKPKKKTGQPISSFATISLDDATVEACQTYATNQKSRFKLFCLMSLAVVKNVSALVHNKVIQSSSAKSFVAYKVGGLIGGDIDSDFKGVKTFRAPKESDSPELRKLLGRWNTLVSRMVSAGALLQRLEVKGIHAENEPRFSTKKMYALFPAIARAMKIKGLQKSNDKHQTDITALTVRMFKESLRSTADEIAGWHKPDTDDGTGDADSGGEAGQTVVQYPAPNAIVKAVNSDRYTRDEVKSMVESMTDWLAEYDAEHDGTSDDEGEDIDADLAADVATAKASRKARKPRKRAS